MGGADRKHARLEEIDGAVVVLGDLAVLTAWRGVPGERERNKGKKREIIKTQTVMQRWKKGAARYGQCHRPRRVPWHMHDGRGKPEVNPVKSNKVLNFCVRLGLPRAVEGDGGSSGGCGCLGLSARHHLGLALADGLAALLLLGRQGTALDLEERRKKEIIKKKEREKERNKKERKKKS